MNSKSPKPKFIPPLKTAASYLRTISDGPEHFNLEIITPKESPHAAQFQRKNSTIVRPLCTTAQTQSLKTSLTISKQASSRLTRDVSHLQDFFKNFNSDSDLQPSISILPKNIDQLRTYVAASRTVESRVKSKRSHVCFKERCLENVNESIALPSNWKIFEDYNRMSIEFGSPTGSYDIINLKEWYKYMKEAHLNKIIVEDKKSERFKIVDSSQLENYELIIKAGLKEILRQLSVQSYERGELLMDMIQGLVLYWNAKLEHFESSHSSKTNELIGKIQSLGKELDSTKSLLKEKEKSYLHDIEVLKSDNLLKAMEIERLMENIKKLKAERVYRTKQELERYNQMIKKFQEFREYTMTAQEDPSNAMIARALQKKKESLITLILSKLQLYRRNSTQYASGLTDQQLIEHEMLSTDTESLFIEKDSQTEFAFIGKSVYVNAVPATVEIAIETEEIVNLILEAEEEKNNEKPMKKKKEPERFSISITNENEEKIVAFQKRLKSVSEISENSRDRFSDDSEIEINEPELLPEPARKYSVVNLFKKREIISKDTQTDDSIFLQLTRKDEEELLDWMLKDRKDYLKNLQREILTKKQELHKVSATIPTHQEKRTALSFNMEDEKGTVFNSNASESFELPVEEDFDQLKKEGVLTKDIDIHSWKYGYTYGYGKAKVDQIDGSHTPRPSIKNELDTESSAIDDVVSIHKEISSFENAIRKYKNNAVSVEEFKISTRKGTKFQEFHFQRKEAKQQTLKPAKRPDFVTSFLQENLKSIIKQTKMSRKMMVKTIGSIYTSAISRSTVNEFECLSHYVYDEFLAKYGQKSVAVKKVIEFISALLKYPDSRRTVVFLRLLGASYKIGLETYSRPRESFNFFVQLNRMIERSKLGIISIDDIADYQFTPAIRAIECARELMSLYFDSSKVQNIITTIEKSSHPDPKKINKFGIIDLEFLQEYLLTEYDCYNKELLGRITALIQPFAQVYNKEKIHKLDFIMIIRYFNHDKAICLFNPKAPLDSFEKFCGHPKAKCTISIKHVINLCFQHKLFSLTEMESAITEDSNDAFTLVTEGIIRLEANLLQVMKNYEQYVIDEFFANNWKSKIKMIMSGKSFNQKNALLLWKVFNTEISRLISEH